MPATLTLLDLAGSVALLLWGLHMVQTGVMRAFGSDLRRTLGMALGSRFKAFLAGLGITALLQSSTATGMMATSFTADGLVGLVPALALMLGANIGTTLIVQAVSFDMGPMAPLLILAGVVAFRRGTNSRTRDLGRAGIGLGLMMLALQRLMLLIEPAGNTPALRLLLDGIAAEPLLDILLAAGLTWASHSSVAIVLLIMSFAAKGVVPLHTAFALVLGANLGSAINPLLEGSAISNPADRRLPLGNFLNRVVGCLLALPLLGWAGHQFAWFETGAPRQVANFHTIFNIALALLFFPFLPAFARLLKKLRPDGMAAEDPGTPAYLDTASLGIPSLAIANAARETLRMADVAEAMLRGALDVFDSDDRKRVSEIRRMDDVLDRLNNAIKRYLTQIPLDDLDGMDQQRIHEVLSFATNLEQVGDVIDRNLMDAAARKIKRRLAMSEDGQSEIRSMMYRLIDNARLASNVFLSGDARAARQLLDEKAVFRDLESQATLGHFGRLRAGRVESLETSSLHLDMLRDIRLINNHLTTAAYFVLENRGELPVLGSEAATKAG